MAATVLSAASGRAGAQSYSQFIAFGDSNIDSGYYRALPSPGAGSALFNTLWPSAVAHGAGTPTTRPGAMSSEALAAMFGLTALPANQPGGTNYATSGAKNVTVNSNATGGFREAIPTVNQVANYLAANGGRADGNALYLVSSGANDVSFAIGDSGAGPFPANPTAYLVGAATSLAVSLRQLQNAGGRYIVVPNLAVSFPVGGGAGNAIEPQAKLDYSTALWSGLAASGVNFIPADWNAVRLAIAADRTAFGFQFIGTAAGQTACSQPAGITTAWALLCSSDPAAPSTLVSPDADRTRLFADDGHLTTAGQKIQADYFYSLVVAPSQISFLPEVTVKTRAGMVNAILNQIPLSQGQRGASGFNGWVTGEVSTLVIDNYRGFPNDPGTPVAGSAGLDYRISSTWLLGAAISAGTTRQTYSTLGHFTQDAFAASLYAAWLDGPYWANIVASAGVQHYDVRRNVQIGITVQPNAGSTDGTNVSLALETGYRFVHGALTHGPVAGITLQQVEVDGFTESGSFTSLAFQGQRRESAVTALGYQVSYDAGPWRPFAKATWNHELVSDDRAVTAFLTTTTAPGYSLPAVVVGRDWGAASVGTTLKLPWGMTGMLAGVGVFAQEGVANYGFQLGINAALN